MRIDALAALSLVVAMAPFSSVRAATPTLGAHDLVYYRLDQLLGGGGVGISTAPMNTQTSGSTILALVARGNGSDFTGNSNWLTTPATNVPTDNLGNGNPIQLVPPTTIRFTLLQRGPFRGRRQPAVMGRIQWPCLPLTRSLSPLSKSRTPARLRIPSGTESRTPNANTSLSVTTTGPATLIAYWLGDHGGSYVTAVPNNGFSVIDWETVSSDAVETFVATENVSTAGTYNVTWAVTPTQGAQMWLVAVQNVPEPASLGILFLARRARAAPQR